MNICIWVDGDWCYEIDVEGYTWKSDDYMVKEVPDDINEEAIEDLVLTMLKSGQD